MARDYAQEVRDRLVELHGLPDRYHQILTGYHNDQERDGIWVCP